MDEPIKTPAEPSDAIALASKKVEDLKKEIKDIGFDVEETENGEIKISKVNEK